MASRIVTVVLAMAALLFFGYWSVIFAGWAEASSAPPGWDRAVAAIPGLVASAVAGLLAILAFQWLLNRRIVFWWLLAALILPTWRFVTLLTS
ncbi:hypothetical protein [Nonomuraea sp. NPDC050310]|uniref:hypothetical protein n=1 Tax=Nonomuraea sp. NPDC050310 TaxID=3154935 RepID=UPI00340AF2F6